ncbi:MAG: phage tail protein [Bacilli bacterium]|nr:phage tail protein [Bacilli bacterium]MBR6690759.1 phage tail protein [Bacilli bacterium]
MKIYSLDTTDFSNNGYGFLTDVVRAEVEEEINGQYVLNLEYLTKGHLAEYLVRENIIVCKVADGTEQPFRIKYIEQTFKTLLIKAYHISYDLAEDLVIDIAPTNLTGQAFGRWILNNSTTHASTFTFNSNISTTASARYIRKNVLECFMSDDENSMINKFGGEFKRDNYTITFNNRIGADNGVRLLIGKNINEIQITTDDTGIYTRIVPVGYNGLTLPEIYVDSSLINDYPFPKGCIAKFENIIYDPTGEMDGSYTDINDFYDALRAAANNLFAEGIDKPVINVDIDWIDLSKTIEYKDYTSLETIRLGDTLTCDMGTFQYTTRVIYTKYDVFLDRITEFQIGKPVSNYATRTNATIEAVENVDLTNLLEQAQQNASQLLKESMTGYIYFDYENGNLYIMDDPDPDDAVKVWRWNLNGLGYSSTGINGTYGLAITMDGSIVADYITTGTLNTNVINGYDTLVAQVEELYNLVGTKTGTGSITLENAAESLLHKLEIYGDISLVYPSSSSQTGIVPYQNNVLYPSTTLYPKDSYLQIDNILYKLDINFLNYMSSTVYDKYIYEEGRQKIIRNVGIDSNGNMYELAEPIVENRENLMIEIKSNSVLTLLSFPLATLTAEYLLQNEYTNEFATKVELTSSITETNNSIEQKVQAVSDSEGVITAASIKTAINGDTSEIRLEADQLALEGYTTINEGFSIDLNGNMTCNDANINGDIITPTGVLTNLQFGCETWGWARNNVYYADNGGFIGYNFEAGGTSSSTQSYLNFCVNIPENFTVKSAKIRLRHSPMTWYPPTGTSTQAGSCKNMRTYVASNLGQSGQGAYMSEAIIGGYSPTLTLINSVSSHSFSDSAFEEYITEDFSSTFTSSGVYNIVVKSTDGIPSGATYNNAYQVYGAKTGILTGTLEIIGYTSNV